MHHRTAALGRALAATMLAGTVLAGTVLVTAGCNSRKPAAPQAADNTDRAGGAVQSRVPAGEIRVYAATPLTGTLTALGKVFEDAYPGTSVVLTFGAGPALASKITQGAIPDVFVASGAASMKQVTDAQAAEGAPKTLVRDRLVIAVPAANPAKVAALADLSKPTVKVAMCAPEAPCGAAAKRVLDNAKVAVKPTSVETDGAAALSKVGQAAVDAALVHLSDVTAAKSPSVRTIDLAEAQTVDEYPVVLLRSSPNPIGAAAFLGLVSSALGRRSFIDAGFSLP